MMRSWGYLSCPRFSRESRKSMMVKGPILPMYIAVVAVENAKCFLGWFFVKRGDWVRDLVNKDAQAENEAWMVGSEE